MKLMLKHKIKTRLKLKRELGLIILTLYGLGNIVGAGIYVLIGKVVGEAGTNAPLSFIIAAIIAGLTALSYAELSSRYPITAGASNYINEAFNFKPVTLIVGFGLILAGSTSSATLINGMVGYISEILSLNHNILIISVLLILGAILFSGIKNSSLVATTLTAIEVSGLLMIIIMGYIGSGPAANLQSFNPMNWGFSVGSIPIIFSAAFLSIYAYFGFEDMVDVVEEVKKPKVNMPRALLLSLLLATLLYLMVLGVAMGNVPILELAKSDAPLKMVFTSVTTINPGLIVIIGIIAIGNGIIVNAVMGSRIFYGLSEVGMLPKIFLKLNKKSVPLYSTFIVLIFIAILAIFVPLVPLAKLTSVILLIIFNLVNLSLIKIKLGDKRRNQPDADHFKTNVLVPILGFASTSSLLGFELFKLIGKIVN